MRRTFAGFDWDNGNRGKCQKHGVPIGAIESLLSGMPKVAPDPAHSRAEDRFIAVGRTEDGRPIFVAFTFRDIDGAWLIRPISARYMHQREIEAYEKKDT
jgi:uncharacterized DUF497 family protein